MKCMVVYQYPTCDMHFVHCKDELISEIPSGILYKLVVKSEILAQGGLNVDERYHG